MRKALILLLVLSGLAPSAARRYELVPEKKSWVDAQSHCRESGVDLATVETRADALELRSEAQRGGFVGEAWVGLYLNTSTWKWSYEAEPLGALRKWSVGQPNNAGGKEECGGTTKWTWFDGNCLELLPFVCFDAGGGFVYYPDGTPWLVAQSICRQNHTDLASVRTAADHAAVTALVTTTAWIGLYRDTWKWSDHTHYTGAAWGAGQPDNALGNEDCGAAQNGLADDVPCAGIRSFYCSVDTGQRVMVRLTLSSSVDVNDALLKDSLLEKMKEKLKDQGLEPNVTLTWREQSGGVTFYRIRNESVNMAECEHNLF